MPLTNKEKMARRQAKIASDPVKREQYLKSEHERKKKRKRNAEEINECPCIEKIQS